MSNGSALLAMPENKQLVYDESADPDSFSVMLVDGKAIVCSAIAQFLNSQEGIEVIAKTEDLQKAFLSALGHKPDVIVFDPELISEEEAVESIGKFKENSPDSSILILTDRESPKFASEVITAGAIGFILKNEEPEDLIRAVFRAAKKKPTISPRIAFSMASHRDGVDDLLTERETEIIGLIALGHSNADIAEILFLSARTIESHRASIVRKLDATKRSDLVSFAIENNIVKFGNRY
jgi:two-component system response regulator NreC